MSGVPGPVVGDPVEGRGLVAKHPAQFIGHGVLGGFFLGGLLPAELDQFPDRSCPPGAVRTGWGSGSGHGQSLSHQQQPTQPSDRPAGVRRLSTHRATPPLGSSCRGRTVC